MAFLQDGLLGPSRRSSTPVIASRMKGMVKAVGPVKVRCLPGQDAPSAAVSRRLVTAVCSGVRCSPAPRLCLSPLTSLHSAPLLLAAQTHLRPPGGVQGDGMGGMGSVSGGGFGGTMGSSSRGLSGLAGGTTASRGGFGGTAGSSFGGGLPLAHAAQRTSRPGDSFGGGGNASIGSGRRVSSGAGSSRGGGALGDEPSAAHLFAICISPQEPIDSVRAACASLLLLASRDDGRSVATDGGTKTLFTILSIFRCVSLPLFLSSSSSLFT